MGMGTSTSDTLSCTHLAHSPVDIPARKGMKVVRPSAGIASQSGTSVPVALENASNIAVSDCVK